MDLLEEGGYGALTVEAVCARAGATPPSIYARAGNKEGLLLAVYEHAMQRIDASGFNVEDPTWDTMEPGAIVRAAVDVVCRGWLEHAGLLRPTVHRAAHDQEIFQRGSKASRRLATDFGAVLAKAGTDRRDADRVFRLVYAALVQRVMYGERFESDVPLSDHDFKEMLRRMAVRFLDL